MPEDADDEMDIATARRGSTMMAIVERKNNISSLQKQELLHLWTGGCYFSYSRYVIDSDRAGVTQQPVVQPVDTQVLPDRFLCPSCGDVTPADQIGPWTRPMCPNCGSDRWAKKTSTSRNRCPFRSKLEPKKFQTAW
jgi:hypothetical protein